MIVWAWLDPAVGREHSGRRPAVVVSSTAYLDTVDKLVVVLPVATKDRGWPNHIPVSPAELLPQPSWVVTEQPRTISRERVVKTGGVVDGQCLAAVDRWTKLFLCDPQS
jgi:mRNA interferase MazF